MAHDLIHALKEQKVAFVAPTRRELYAAASLAAGGARVLCWAPREGRPGPEVRTVDSLEAATEGSAMVIAPLHVPSSGVVDLGDGRVLAPGRDVATLGQAGVVVIGMLPASWRPLLDDRTAVVEMMPRDDFAFLNAVPTAEGALAEAMTMTKRTIAWERSLVLGFGRVGIIMAQRLAALKGRVTVLARSSRDLAAAEACGYTASHISRLAETISSARYVFNTVPAEVLSRSVLISARAGTAIIDLASAPGGTDFTAARDMGLDARLCPALPGRVAPETAGQIVARVAALIWGEVEQRRRDPS